MQQWLLAGTLRAVHCDVIEMSRQRGYVEVKAADLSLAPRGSGRLLRDLLQSVLLKAIALEIEISPDGCHEQQQHKSSQRPANRSFPLHATPKKPARS